MPKKILQQISENVEEAGTPENIAFWSPDQFNIASNCLDYKRVLFMPQKAGFSTGKSVHDKKRTVISHGYVCV